MKSPTGDGSIPQRRRKRLWPTLRSLLARLKLLSGEINRLRKCALPFSIAVYDQAASIVAAIYSAIITSEDKSEGPSPFLLLSCHMTNKCTHLIYASWLRAEETRNSQTWPCSTLPQHRLPPIATLGPALSFMASLYPSLCFPPTEGGQVNFSIQERRLTITHRN